MREYSLEEVLAEPGERTSVPGLGRAAVAFCLDDQAASISRHISGAQARPPQLDSFWCNPDLAAARALKLFPWII
jgi:hypothetical protein